ncbi:MAG: hypothetical protein HC875_41365 [Anaerolineales bacterium]|nr:hypothetical protein [Anaerolineales bacterium]
MNEIIKRTLPDLLLFGGMLALVIGLSGIRGAELSWAAPDQNPYSQTIPTRFPDETTEPPAAPSPAVVTPPRQQTSNDNQADKPQLSATPTVRPPNSPQINASVTPLPPATASQKQTSQPSAQEATAPQKTILATQAPANKQEGAPLLLTASPTLRAGLPPATTQAEGVEAVEPLSPEKQTEALAPSKGSLGWIYGLVAGVILLAGGIALVRRA